MSSWALNKNFKVPHSSIFFARFLDLERDVQTSLEEETFLHKISSKKLKRYFFLEVELTQQLNYFLKLMLFHAFFDILCFAIPFIYPINKPFYERSNNKITTTRTTVVPLNYIMRSIKHNNALARVIYRWLRAWWACKN